MTEYFARKDYLYGTGDAIFSIPFSYLDKKHIVVFIDNIQTTNFTYLTDTQIRVLDNIQPNSIISIRRTTPLKEKFVTFSDTSMLDKDTQNLAQDQMFNVVQELYDNNEEFRGQLLNVVDKNAKEYLEKTTILQNTIDSTVDTVTEAVNLLDETTAKVQKSLETCVEKAEVIEGQVQRATEKAEIVENLYNTAVENIEQAQDIAQNVINSALETAKTELLDTKTEIVTDLIENATNEALTEVNNVKTSAIDSINTSLENSQEALNEAVKVAQDAATTATEKADIVQNTYTSAVTTITDTKNLAVNEILEVKTGVIDDLVQNAAGEALKAVENTKNTAVETINSTVQSAQTQVDQTIAMMLDDFNSMEASAIEEVVHVRDEAIEAIAQARDEYRVPEIEIIEEDDNTCYLSIKKDDGTMTVSSNLKAQTPIKGVDYFTTDEINDIKTQIIEAVGTEGSASTSSNPLSKMLVLGLNNSKGYTINIDLETPIYFALVSSADPSGCQITFNLPELPELTALTFEIRLNVMSIEENISFANVVWLGEDTPVFEAYTQYLLAFRYFGSGSIYGNVQGVLE